MAKKSPGTALAPKKEQAPKKSPAKKKTTGKKAPKKSKALIAREAREAADAALAAATRKLTHYDAICEMERQADDAREHYLDKKEEAKEAKAEWSAMETALRRLIRNGPDPQKRIEFSDSSEGTAQPAGSAGALPAPAPAALPGPEPEWKSRPVSVMKLAKATVKKLEDADLDTLGKLDAWWKSGRPLTDKKGIGAEAGGKVADAWADYARDHQEVYGLDDGAGEATPAGDPPKSPGESPDEGTGDEGKEE